MDGKNAVLEVRGLNKQFPAFRLKDVSFTLREGEITGFIGRNGAGKSTTLNSLLNFVHPDSGEIRFWGMDLKKHEKEIKQRIGFVSAGLSYYMKKRIKTIGEVTSTFYDHWDNESYMRYLDSFGIDEKKMPEQLSNGMKVKFSLALALSHNADLLILDEPTSGLDPVSREDILEIFMDLSDAGKTILFSTHITSDLDKCADRILYIRDGVIRADKEFGDFADDYRLVEYDKAAITPEDAVILIGERRSKRGHTALVRKENAARFAGRIREAGLDEIMVHLEKEAGLDG